MPDLEPLKKQAKRYLRWHRDGYFPVAARIRSFLPRFQGLTDHQILAAPFQLSDAQELVARKAGFDGWPALTRSLSAMTEPRVPAAASTLVAAEPQLFVADMAASLAFYGRLGFATAFAYGEPPFYAQVVRDGARLNLRLAQGPIFDAAFQARNPDVLAATLALDDAKPLFLEYQAAGIAFHQSLRTEPWGARTFIVEDPDGNRLLFAGAD